MTNNHKPKSAIEKLKEKLQSEQKRKAALEKEYPAQTYYIDQHMPLSEQALIEIYERVEALEAQQKNAEKNLQLAQGPCAKVQHNDKTCVDCGWNHSTGKREFQVQFHLEQPPSAAKSNEIKLSDKAFHFVQLLVRDSVQGVSFGDGALRMELIRVFGAKESKGAK